MLSFESKHVVATFYLIYLKIDLPQVSVQRDESCKYCKSWRLCVDSNDESD